MSRLDDDIAGSKPPPSANMRPTRKHRVITVSGAAVVEIPTVTAAGTVKVKISQPATRPVDLISEFADRWLKLLLPANVYRVVEQVIADWQNEYATTDSKLRWWITVKNALHLLWVLVRALLPFLLI